MPELYDQDNEPELADEYFDEDTGELDIQTLMAGDDGSNEHDEPATIPEATGGDP